MSPDKVKDSDFNSLSAEDKSLVERGKRDGTGANSAWLNNGLSYGLSSENYSMDELEKIVHGMIK